MPREGFFEKIFDRFRLGSAEAERVVHDAWIKQLEREDKEERDAAQRLIDWYSRNRDEMVGHLKAAAKKTFQASELNEWQWPIINGVPRTIQRLSLVYKETPQRILKKGGKSLEPDSPDYQRVYGPKGLFQLVDIGKKWKEIDNYSTLLNALHVEVVPRRNAIDWDIRLRPGVIVVPDPNDYLEFEKIAYLWNVIDPDTLKLSEGWVYWDAESHYYVASNNETYGLSNEDGTNPYNGEIPIVTIRKEEQDEYWGRYGAGIVDAFEAANIQLANMWENGFLQTHGIPFSVNCGFTGGSTVHFGPKRGVHVDKVGKDEVEPSLSFVKPEADIKEVTDMVDWYIQNAGNAYGLPRGDWAQDAPAPESGFAKLVQMSELLETRANNISMYVRYEKELFHKSVMVWNRWAREMQHDKIPEDIELEVIFPDVSFPESSNEKLENLILGTKAGVDSPVRYLMRKHNLDEETAVQEAAKLAKENAGFKKAMADVFGFNDEPTDDKGDEE